jgi:uncharacterized protein (TIGR03118 family)
MVKTNSIWAQARLVLSLAALAAPAALPQTNSFLRHNLVSDLPGIADFVDPNLVNPWGISASATSPFWISNNGSGTTTLYNTDGQAFPPASPIIVQIPPPMGGTDPGAITGQVFNSTTGFAVAAGKPASFIFATEDGTIAGWNSTVDATHAVTKVDNSASGAVYKGLALATAAGGPQLYATNFNAGTVDVFDTNFASVTAAGAFQDPNIPPGFAPFNIANLNGKLYVTYAMQDDEKHDDVAGAGNGYVDVYDLSGKLLQRLISQAQLNSPWGLAMSPGTFGSLSNALLVGNFGDGGINAFDPASGAYLGTMQDKFGNPILQQGLWAIQFGNGGSGGAANTLYFTAGISGGDDLEAHGLFGSFQAADNLGSCIN